MMRRKLGIAAAIAGAMYLGVCAAMFVAQRSLIYNPTPAHETITGAQRLDFRSGEETLRIWSHSTPGPAAAIYFGGKGEDVAKPFGPFAAALPDRSLYFVNYRGYGGSTGSPTEAGLFEDALAVFDEVHAKHADVAVIGRSLGTGVAAFVAASRPVTKLVLVTPYDSVENVAKGRYPWLPVGLFLQDKFDSASRVPRITAKTFVLLAESDVPVPPPRSAALIEKFPSSQIRVETIRGSSHNSIGNAPEYLPLIAGFLGT